MLKDSMNDSQRKITEGLVRAMRTETEGYHFYSMAAQSMTDPQGREVFVRLAAEEEKHLVFLRRQWESYRDQGQVDATQPLPKAPTGVPGPIFSEGIRSRIREAHYEMTALSIGIQLELNSQRFYQEQAQGVADEAVAAFYQELARWETHHYQALLAQYESLKESYWNEAGFSPY